MIKIGSLFQERYHVDRYIGRGGMSDVYHAIDNISKNSVAIKIAREDADNKAEMYQRFTYEIRIAAAIQNHFNIVKIYDFGKSGDGLPYMVTEYISGQTLRDILDFRRTFGFEEACYIISQMLDALNELHIRGIIHRDIKSQNIYLLADSTVKLADFGISIFINDKNPINESKKIVGTPQYLAPEIIDGGKASPLSDIYSLGITFFELITGTVPFDHDDVHEILKDVISKDIPNIHLYRSSCPDNLARIIYKACAKNPKNRYQNVMDFKRDITELLDNKKNLRSQNWFERFFGLKGK